jgi:hypothetical protein
VSVYVSIGTGLAGAGCDIRYGEDDGGPEPEPEYEVDYTFWSTRPTKASTPNVKVDVDKAIEAAQLAAELLGGYAVVAPGPGGVTVEMHFDGRASADEIRDALVFYLSGVGVDWDRAFAGAGNMLTRIEDKGGVVKEYVLTMWLLDEGKRVDVGRHIVDAGEPEHKAKPAPEAAREAEAARQAEVQKAREMAEIGERIAAREAAAATEAAEQRARAAEAEAAGKDARIAELEAALRRAGIEPPAAPAKVSKGAAKPAKPAAKPTKAKKTAKPGKAAARPVKAPAKPAKPKATSKPAKAAKPAKRAAPAPKKTTSKKSSSRTKPAKPPHAPRKVQDRAGRWRWAAGPNKGAYTTAPRRKK